jgi:hypothetical protein
MGCGGTSAAIATATARGCVEQCVARHKGSSVTRASAPRGRWQGTSRSTRISSASGWTSRARRQVPPPASPPHSHAISDQVATRTRHPHAGLALVNDPGPGPDAGGKCMVMDDPFGYIPRRFAPVNFEAVKAAAGAGAWGPCIACGSHESHR